MVGFPDTPNDDQVDATTQFLDWIIKNAHVPSLPQRGFGAAATATFGPLSNTPLTGKVNGVVVVPGRRSF